MKRMGCPWLETAVAHKGGAGTSIAGSQAEGGYVKEKAEGK